MIRNFHELQIFPVKIIMSQSCFDQKCCLEFSRSPLEAGNLLSEESSSTETEEAAEEKIMSYNNDLFGINHGDGELHNMESIKEEYEYESSIFSFDFQSWSDNVYVAVGKNKSSSSMDALLWTLNHFVTPSTMLHLIHVFPAIRHIPSPLGMLPRSQVNPKMVQNHLTQERSKKKKLLQKFIDTCHDSKVKPDTMLIENDNIAEGILGLIPILNIRKLVVGTSKSSLRKLGSPKLGPSRRGSGLADQKLGSPKLGSSRRGSGLADQILQNAPDTCEIKIVCEEKEVIDQMIGWSSPSSNNDSCKTMQEEDQDQPNSYSAKKDQPNSPFLRMWSKLLKSKFMLQ